MTFYDQMWDWYWAEACCEHLKDCPDIGLAGGLLFFALIFGPLIVLEWREKP